jgi:hypothetical protein
MNRGLSSLDRFKLVCATRTPVHSDVLIACESEVGLLTAEITKSTQC